MQRQLFIFILLLSAMVQVACQPQDKNSILIIAADDLVVSDVNCVDESTEESKSGLDMLCKESVRFTHAFSPSTMSVPTLASLMTGLYPFQHGVRHNAQFLSASLTTAPKEAVSHAYRTAFFSGGAPVLRKTGLNQGFEVFDDNLSPNLHSVFRPFSRSTHLFEQWLRQDVGGASFFAVLYAPDLIFTNTETLSEMGEPRNLSYESQLDEFDENLYDLFQSLKKEHRWDRTTVVLVGLNGHTHSDRPQESAVLNLHGENMQVALLVKPSQRKRDEGITWKVDTNVSLVDLGRTLFDLVGANAPAASEDFPVQSLLSQLHQPDTAPREDRPLLMESAWGLWKGLSNIRNAVVKNHILFINDAQMRVYNTLVDRMEMNPLPATDIFSFSPHSVTEALQKNSFAPWTGIDAATAAKLKLSTTLWLGSSRNSLLLRNLKNLVQRYPNDTDLPRWTAALALEQKDWATLREMGEKTKNGLWSYAAEKNLGTVRARYNDPCLRLLKEKSFDVNMFKKCGDPLMLDFVDWIRSDVRGLARESQRKRFERSYRSHRIDLNLYKSNIGTGQIWDMNKESAYEPGMIDLVLSLPEYHRLAAQLEKAIHVRQPDED